MNTVAILLLAAGASTRMNGRDKLLEPINGTPLLAVMIARALATDAPVFVTLPADNPKRAALVGPLASPIIVSDARSGMAASLRAGIAALPSDCSAAMIVPADMPDLQTTDFKQMLQVFNQDKTAPILRATTQTGRHGHPVILPQRFFQEIKTLTGDRGAAPLLRKHSAQIRTVPLAGTRATTDLDTPQDWAAWHAQQRATP